MQVFMIPRPELYETALAQWRGGPEAKPLDEEERTLLEDILAVVDVALET